jgi:hypothetical protein
MLDPWIQSRMGLAAGLRAVDPCGRLDEGSFFESGFLRAFACDPPGCFPGPRDRSNAGSVPPRPA